MVRVIVVGAGIGGLALAQGLVREGIETVVLDRDADLRATIGHSIQLDPAAMDGLRELLPADAVRSLSAVAHGTWVETGGTLLDHHARILTADRASNAPRGPAIDRVTLRVLLAGGLGPRLRLRAEVIGHEVSPDGTVAALLAGGEHVAGDLLVAADGVGSPIAHALAGMPTAGPTSLVGFAGQTSTLRLPRPVTDVYGTGAVVAVGPGGSAIYAVRHGGLDQDEVAAFSAQPLHPDPIYAWGSVMLEWAQTAPLLGLSGRELGAAIAAHLRERRWSENLIRLVEEAGPETLTSYRFRAAPTYEAGIAPWSPGIVTALGDAVHAMPPTGGKGASTAIRDAHVLCRELLAARDGRRRIAAAVSRYERQMRVYAARAVAEARRPSGWARGPAGTRRTPSHREPTVAAAAVSWAQGAEPAPVGA